VTADPVAEGQAFRQFMAVIKPGQSSAPATGHSGHAGPARAPTVGLETDISAGKTQTAALANHGMPIYYPRVIASGTTYEGPTVGEYPRAYTIHDPEGNPHAAYRIVLAFNATLGQFYGVQGITWRNAPILASPSEIRTVAGKRLELHFDGSKLRLVAWRTRRGVYWISNTLSLDLSNQQMLGIAASLTRA
jgi:hypothetical protein